MAYTYILRLSSGAFYVGSCRDLHIRVEQHKNGYVKSTKNKRPLMLLYARYYETYSEAYAEEKRIKGWKKRSSIDNIIRYDKKNILAPSSSPV